MDLLLAEVNYVGPDPGLTYRENSQGIVGSVTVGVIGQESGEIDVGGSRPYGKSHLVVSGDRRLVARLVDENR